MYHQWQSSIEEMAEMASSERQPYIMGYVWSGERYLPLEVQNKAKNMALFVFCKLFRNPIK